MERESNIGIGKISSESGVDWQTHTGKIPVIRINSGETEHEVSEQESKNHDVVETAIEVVRNKSHQNFIEIMGI